MKSAAIFRYLFIPVALLAQYGVLCKESEVPESVSYEAEANTGSRNAFFETSEGNYTGSGYMNFNDEGFIEWNNVTAFGGAGDYILKVRYAVANEPGRACHVFINDSKEVAAVFQFPYTGGYDTWKFDEVAVPLTNGTNKVRIEAIYKGPHVDGMNVRFRGPSASTTSPPSSTVSSAASTEATTTSVSTKVTPPNPTPKTPATTTKPTTTVKPTTTTTKKPPAPADTAPRKFQLKMFFEKGMTWQETFKRKAWCVQCTECENKGDTKIKECNEKDKKQFWTFEGGRLRSAEKTDLCLEIGLPSSKKVKMGVCDKNNEKQVWLGFHKTQKFQFRALRYPKRCLTQEHHPKSGEYLIMQDCHEAQENDGSIENPNDDTSHWVIGKWTGHSDEGVKVYRHHYP